MGLFDRRLKNNSFMDVIRCDEPSYLIWKWHPAGSQQGANSRENAIRWGSSLRVKDGEVAVFVYTQENGTVQDYIVGPFDAPIQTENFPVWASIVGLAYGGGTPFQAEIYFINLAKIIRIRFGVPFFDVYDPRFPDFGVPVAVRGTINFKIDDYREFIKLNRLRNFDLNDFQKQIRDVINRYIKDAVCNAPAEHNIPVIQIESKTAQINDIVEYDLKLRLKEDFGVSVSGMDIGAIEIDKTSDSYFQLLSITRNATSATVQAQTAAAVKDIRDRQHIDAEHYQETLRIQREESRYAQRKSTQSANFAAYQVEKQAEVGVAGASALGQLGASGADNLNLSGNGTNIAAVAASMAVGGAIGQNIAGTMNTMMGGFHQAVQTGAVPPPIPTAVYHVAVNGQAAGPFDIPTLTQMAASGQLTAASLVWRSGMAQWVCAETIDELKGIFANSMPPILPSV